jgi:acetyl-CoA acetyltransferase
MRTASGAYCGLLREIPVEKLAAVVLNEAIKRAGIRPEVVDEVIMGQCHPNGECPNVARLAPLEAGWPVEIPEFMLDSRCCAGLQAVWSGAMQLQTENAEIVVSGGVESQSRIFLGSISSGEWEEEWIRNGDFILSIMGACPFGVYLFTTGFSELGVCTSLSKDSVNSIQ